jgi:cold shock CspA family protein
MEGKVLWFNTYKGYGEIETTDGDRFFLTSEDLKDISVKKIRPNLKVSFQVSMEFLFGWPRATKVQEVSGYRNKRTEVST